MADNPKIYNSQYLSRFTTLDTVEGVRNCGGSRQAYFARLSEFEAKAPALLANLPEIRPRKEMLADLFELQTLLHGLCETQIVNQIDDLVITVNVNKDKKAIGNGLHTVWVNLTRLAQKIRDSAVNRDADAPPGSVSSVAAVPVPAAEKTRIPVSAPLFSKLSALMEDFDFAQAAHEIESLTEFSFGDEIDGIITGIGAALERSDFKYAHTEVKRLLKRAAEKEKENEKEKPAQAPPAEAKKVILAIDDMPDILTLLKNMLKGQFNVFCVTNHLAALKFASSNTPDLILLDIEMPDMDGFALLKILRQIESCRNVPVIFLTGNVSVENVRASVLSGGNDFVKKPVDYDLLISKINRQLDMVKK